MDYNSSANMGIIHLGAKITVTIAGVVNNALWDGTKLEFTAQSYREGATVDLHYSFVIVGDTITGGVGTWTNTAKGCGGTEKYSGSRIRKEYP